MLKDLQTRLAEIQAEFAKNITKTDTEIVDVFTGYCPKWEDYLATENEEAKLLKGGVVVQYNAIKFLVCQDVHPIDTQTPSDEGMLAVYKPYRDSNEYQWLYGEYVEIGWIRYIVEEYEDEEFGTLSRIKRYIAIQDPVANIYSPELVPAIWELLQDEEI